MRHAFVGVALSLSLLAGCGGRPPVETGRLDKTAPAPLGLASIVDAAQPYRIGARDELSVTVFREAGLSLERVTVDAAGGFQMPLLGRINVAGQTAEQLSATLRTQLGRYLVEPNVAVNVLTTGSYRVVVEGSVEQPGIYPIERNTTLLGGIAQARGPSFDARLGQVAIFRTIDGAPSVAVFDLTEVRAGRMVDPILQPGDKVVVGTSQVARLLRQALPVLPALAIFTRF